MPGGVLHENMFATSSCLTNVDGNYVSLALKGLRLGIATAYGAQIPLELAQDALWGTPTPHAIKVDLGIIDPEYVNIAVNGHEPMIGAALIDAAHEAGGPGEGQGRRRQGPAHRRLHRDRPGARPALRGRRRLRRAHRQLADGGARGRHRRPRRLRRRHELRRADPRRHLRRPRHAPRARQRPRRRRRRRDADRLRRGQRRRAGAGSSSTSPSPTTPSAGRSARSRPSCAPATPSPASAPRASSAPSAAASTRCSTSSRTARSRASAAS